MLRNRRENARRYSVVKPSTQSVPPPNGTLPNDSSSRIPALLQAVFLSSNRGNVVHEPPPNRIAHRVFFVKKLRVPWGKKKKQEDSFSGIERNESSTSSNDDTIPTTISAASSSASSTPTKYFQDIVVYPDAVPKSKAVPTEPLKVCTCVLYRRKPLERNRHPNLNSQSPLFLLSKNRSHHNLTSMRL